MHSVLSQLHWLCQVSPSIPEEPREALGTFHQPGCGLCGLSLANNGCFCALSALAGGPKPRRKPLPRRVVSSQHHVKTAATEWHSFVEVALPGVYPTEEGVSSVNIIHFSLKSFIFKIKHVHCRKF